MCCRNRLDELQLMLCQVKDVQVLVVALSLSKIGVPARQCQSRVCARHTSGGRFSASVGVGDGAGMAHRWCRWAPRMALGASAGEGCVCFSCRLTMAALSCPEWIILGHARRKGDISCMFYICKRTSGGKLLNVSCRP